MHHGPDDSDEHDLGALFLKVGQIAQNLPGAQFAQRQLERVETRVLCELRERMDRLDPATETVRVPTAHDAASTTAQALPDLPARMSALLRRADEQSRADALADLFHQIIGELVADEARILGALSDGSKYPLIHAGYAPRVGPMTRRLVDNFSSIGKPAGVKLLEHVPAYIAHLRALGLVETGPEDPSLEIKYQILESDVSIRQALEAEHKGVGMVARYLRRTLQLTEFGKQFWAACVSAD